MSDTIEITPNVLKCLQILREAVESLPEGDLKTQAEGALEYMERTARGEPQPLEGETCPVNTAVIPPTGTG